MRDIGELPAFPAAARWPARGLPESLLAGQLPARPAAAHLASFL